MTEYNFRFTEKKITDSEVFGEASAAELKLILALFERSGRATDEELIEVVGTSRARITSAIALWEEAGVIVERGEGDEPCENPYGNRVTTEFPDRFIAGELEEESAAEVARTIRKNSLASLFDELAVMMNKTMLTPMEIKNITALCSQYGLDEEYIATLAAHIAAERELTASILVTRAKNYAAKDITDAADLESYLSAIECEKREFTEYKRIFGIHNRSLTKTEMEYLRKWSREFGFDIAIIGLAYDISAINTSKLSFPYMDRLLSDWKEASCKTVAECEKRYEAVKLQRDMEANEKRERAKPAFKKEAKPKPKLGNFDPEEAFRLAVERSYADNKDNR